MSSIVLLVSGLVAFSLTHHFYSSYIARGIYHADPELGPPAVAHEAWPLLEAVPARPRTIGRRRRRRGVAAQQEGE